MDEQISAKEKELEELREQNKQLQQKVD